MTLFWFTTVSPSQVNRHALKGLRASRTLRVETWSSVTLRCLRYGHFVSRLRIFRDTLVSSIWTLPSYRCLVKEYDRDAPSFLLESESWSRCFYQIVAKENMVTILDHQQGSRTEKIVEDPMVVPKRIMDRWKPQLVDELPDVFCESPDIHLSLYDDVLVFDHVEKVLQYFPSYIIHWVRLDQYSSVEEAFNDGVNHLENLVSKVHNISPRRFCAKEHILAGDIFQIVLSRRFERRTFAPEILTRVKKNWSLFLCLFCLYSDMFPQNKITNRPLAGTSRRGKTPKEDLMLEKELLNDEKKCAEHIMFVDLGRNDVGKVSKPGSVKVEKLMNIERYSHVMHISSTITGEMLDNLNSWDVLRAALPVGPVSGAPKLEVTRRGPYSGGFGGISFSWVAHQRVGIGIVHDKDPTDEHRECENKAAALARAIDLAESSF
ncbi:hypothetical protein K2173_012626 [Erythroxylum novogranatense]|uniref:Chorismate-utilising enzyme C-terminal domain-containing protein n=1 Tax=Erythroxylum novogranatense TaxID=1862640 RepID=A0AAV8S7K8_9ROSI|nr:hypothetical protein K2173_012626 [Erythroxylum novogranatense]